MCQSICALQPLAVNVVLHVGTVLSEILRKLYVVSHPQLPGVQWPARCTCNTVDLGNVMCVDRPCQEDFPGGGTCGMSVFLAAYVSGHVG